VSLGAFAVMLAGGLLAAQGIAASPAQAKVLVPATFPSGASSAYANGSGTVLTDPAGQDVLSTITMALGASTLTAANVDFQVFAWDGVGHVPVGPALGTTNTVSVTNTTVANVTFSWPGTNVIPGNQYLVVFQTDNPVVAKVAIGPNVEFRLVGATWNSQPLHHLTQFLFLQTPVVSALSTQAGVPGDPIIITGTGFTDAVAVAFGGVAAPGFTVVSDTQITVTVPPGLAAGSTVDVRVTSDTLHSATSVASSFSIPAATGGATPPAPSNAGPVLATTGATISPPAVISGVALLLAGLIILIVSAARRRGIRRY
jgi:hypothetical protein